MLLDATNGELVRHLPGNGETGWFTAFSGDGSRVATVTPGTREALVWDVRTGALLARPPWAPTVRAVDLGTDGATLYTAGADSALRQWDLDRDRRFIPEVATTRPGRLGWQNRSSRTRHRVATSWPSHPRSTSGSSTSRPGL